MGARRIMMSDFYKEYTDIEAHASDPAYVRQNERLSEAAAGRPIVLYGAGKAAGIALAICIRANLNISAVCDSHKTGVYTVGKLSLPIISPDQLLGAYSEAIVVIASWRFEGEIRSALAERGFDVSRIFSLYCPQRIAVDVFRRDFLAGYEWAYDFYEDSLSKQLVLDRARAYLTSKLLVPNTTRETYYDPEWNFTDSEVFLDGGACDGDTVRGFVRKVDGRYRRIYAFEPDDMSFGELAVQARKNDKLLAMNTGLGERNGTDLLHFRGLVASGFRPMPYFMSPEDKFSDGAFEVIEKPTVSIDRFFQERPFEPLPTFIKLDVEGSEAETLRGAADTIRTQKPKLAICAYHLAEDIYQLPQIIRQIRDDYRFSLRQHDYGYYETILYAY